MKILQVNKFFYRRGGADHHFLDLCDLLSRKGNEVIPFSMRDPKNEASPFSKYFVSEFKLDSFNVRSLLKIGRMLYSFEAKRKISRLIKDAKPEIAHLHLIYHHLSPSILGPLRKAGIPIVMTIHDWKPICPNYLLYTEGAPCVRCKNKKYIQSFTHSCAKGSKIKSGLIALESYFHHWKKYYEDYVDLYIAPSEFVKEMFVSFGWNKNKIQVLPHFLSPIIKASENAAPSPQTTRFAYVGRLSAEKGVDKLVEYWRSKNIQYQLDIFGSGDLYEGLKNLTADNPKIKLLGQIKREEMAEKLKNYSALIVPSEFYETFGLVAIEAWAGGVPVLAHNRGAVVELINASGAGLTFEWGDDSLEKGLEKICFPEFRQKAVDYMKIHHSPNEYYEKISAIYNGLLAKRLAI
ncbi:MAG: glycosyltransferase [Patescibacteria group bacterium]